MNIVEVSVHEDCPEPQWFSKIEPFVQEVLKKLDKQNWEVSVLFCLDPFIHQLNAEYRQKDSATDVRSFEQGEEYKDENGDLRFCAGDIIISLDSLQKNCIDFDVDYDEELKRLLVHGVLHLSGMDHSDNSPEQEMLQFQEELLKGML